VKEGDLVKDGQTLFLVETDKVTAEIPSPVDARVDKIYFKVGQTIHVGDVAVDLDDGSASSNKEVKTETVEEQGSTSVVGEIEVSSEVIPSSSEGVSHDTKVQKKKVLATPVARKLAKDLGVDINDVTGTGPAGRVMKEDIRQHKEGQKSHVESQPVKRDEAVKHKVSSLEGDERVAMSPLRKAIARNMVESKFTIPHTAAMDEVDVSALVAYRKSFNETFSEKQIKVTYMPFIIKAVALALKENPIVNAQLDEEAMEIVYKKAINIGVATDTEAGLMVPVVKDADTKGILSLQSEVADLATRSRNHSIHLDELTDGTFTITNYGSIGAKYGVPVIRFPEAAILGVGTIYKTAGVNEVGDLVVIDALPLSISFDHRIVDGADAGRFLQTVKKYLKQPDLLLMS
jgi:pyruvate dehydrogenase E2 component (dihydrolipoamide acetyltransferase)